jgi:hypothetical protein
MNADSVACALIVLFGAILVLTPLILWVVRLT